MALAGGWSMNSALVLWIILAAKAVASVLYVRARLRLDRGQPHDPTAAWAGHVLAFLLVTALAATGRAPWLAALVFAALLVRAVHGLSARRRVVRPQTLGFQELGLGLATALLVALGYATGD